MENEVETTDAASAAETETKGILHQVYLSSTSWGVVKFSLSASKISKIFGENTIKEIITEAAQCNKIR